MISKDEVVNYLEKLFPKTPVNVSSPKNFELTDEEREMMKSPTVRTKVAAQYLGIPPQKLIWLMENSTRVCKIGEVQRSAAGTRHPVIFPEKLIAYKHGWDLPDDFIDDEGEIADRLERIETAVNQILELMEVR